MHNPGRLALVVLLLLGVGCREAAEPVVAVPVGTAVGSRPPPLRGLLPTGEAFGGIDSIDGSAVLVFYRSAGCGLCRVQLQQIQANLGGYRQQGARVVGITLDPPDVSRSITDELHIDFPLVSVDSAAFRDWGVMDPERQVPLPATYIVDRAGIIRFRHIGRNAADRTTDAGVLTVLQTMSSE